MMLPIPPLGVAGDFLFAYLFFKWAYRFLA